MWDSMRCTVRHYVGPDIKERYTTVMAFADRTSRKRITPFLSLVGVNENGEINDGTPLDMIDFIKIAGDFIKIEDDVKVDIYWDNRLVGAPVYELHREDIKKCLEEQGN